MPPPFTLFFCTLRPKPTMSFNHLSLLFLFWGGIILAQSTDQNTAEEVVFLDPINNNTILGQKDFVNELMSIAGYTVDEIIVYQNLPNHAKIFRVIYNEKSQSGFVFIRWDKNKKENYVANKMIDREVYYNLKAAKEIMRQQTDKEAFNVEDAALQAPDQEKITKEDLEGLREEYTLQQEEKKLKELEKASNKKRRKKKNK